VTRTFASLDHHNYRLWFAGGLVTNIGTWMQRIAQDWLVLTGLTNDSGLAVGIVTGLQFAPTLFLTPYAGLLADRVDRRTLLIATNTALGLIALALGVLVLTDVAQLWHVYVLATLLGVAAAFDNPVRQTFVAELVPPEALPNAVGLNGANFNTARLIGPATAGVLITLVGPGWVFILNAVSFIAPIVALMAMRRDELYVLPHAGRGRGQLREGFAYVRRRTDILVIMGIMAVVGALGLNFQLTSAVMAREVFDRGPGEYGILGSVMAIGAVAGALLAARRRRPQVRLVIAAAFGFGVSLTLSAVLTSFWAYAASGVLVGFSATTMMNSANSALQLSTAPEVRGRVMSLYMLVFLGTTPIGSPFVGWIAETYGARWSVAVGGIVSMVAAAVAALWARSHWHVEVRYIPRRYPFFRVTGPAERGEADPEGPNATAGSAVTSDAAPGATGPLSPAEGPASPPPSPRTP